MTSSRKKIGLALGSGGFKGIVHIGVLKALEENNIPIDYIAGTSIGALIGALYALYKDINRVENIIVGKKKEKLGMLIEPTLKGGFIRGKKIEKLLHDWLDDATFESAKIPIRVVATDLVTGDEVVFAQGRMVPAIRGSLAVPTIFSPYQFENKILVDGGLSNPIPDDIVRQMGADIVISVNLDKCPSNGIGSFADLTLRKTAGRTIDIMRYNLARYSLRNSDIIIEPEMKFVGLKSWTKYFTEEFGPESISAGKVAAEIKIPEILRMLNPEEGVF